MWAAFRSDLKEFVSSVAEESTTVLSAIDSQLQDAEGTEEEPLRSKKVDTSTTKEGDKNDDNEEEGPETEDDDEALSSPEATPDTAASSSGVVYGDDGEVTFAGRDAGYSVTGIISTAEDEMTRRMQSEETYTAPLLPLDVEKKYSTTAKKEMAAKATAEEEEEEKPTNEDDKEKDEDDKEKEEDDSKKDDEKEAKEEEKKETGEHEDAIPAEYADDPVAVEIIEFLRAFKIGEKTAEIAQVLEQHPDSVKVHFESLVPTTVTYEQFWQRYFYRCDVGRIEKEWAAEKERQRKARQEALSGGISTVRNLFGGAVKTLSEGLAVVEQTAARKPSTPNATAYERFQKQQLEADKKSNANTLSAVASSTTSLVGANMSALFGVGSGRRPPFVLNTAVSDAEEGEEGEEEEEELGWDDDEDDEGETPKHSRNAEQQIDFSGSLADRLHQAEEERDLLQKTVEMQSKEIATLKIASDDRSSRVGDSDEVEKLKMLIFEKDSELAALRASLDDNEDGDEDEEDDDNDARKKDKETNKKQAAKLAAQERELAKLSSELDAKNSEVARLTQDLRMAKEKAGQLREELDQEKARLEQTVAELRAQLKAQASTAEEEEKKKSAPDGKGKEEEAEKKKKKEKKEEKKKDGSDDDADLDDDWGEDW